MSSEAEKARNYLQDKDIPLVFESLMTGLMCNKPDDAIDFMMRALYALKTDPTIKLTWETFVDKPPPSVCLTARMGSTAKSRTPSAKAKSPNKRSTPKESVEEEPANVASPTLSKRSVSLSSRAGTPVLPKAPIIVILGCPWHKAVDIANLMGEFNNGDVAYVDVVSLLSRALEKYGESHSDWKEAKAQFSQGHFVDTPLIVKLIRSKLAKCSNAKLVILDGYPQTMEQAESLINDLKILFVGEVRQAIIVDYDQNELKKQLTTRYSDEAMCSTCLESYISGILNATKYFDERQLLTIIPGEQTDAAILEQVRSTMQKFIDEQAEGKKEEPEAAGAPDELERATQASAVTAAVAADEPVLASTPSNDGTEPAAKVTPENTTDSTEQTTTGQAMAIEKGDAQMTNNAEAAAPAQQPMFERPPVVLVMGAPGSFKLSYSEQLAEKYDGFVLISMGRLLTKAVAEHPDDDSWTGVADRMKNGEWIDNGVCKMVMNDAISKVKKAWGYIIEGYPRDLSQMHDFDKMVDKIDLVLLIDCTEKRCTANLENKLSEAMQGEELKQTIRNRITAFKQNTLPLLKFFDGSRKLKVVEGDRMTEQVFADIVKTIDESLFIPKESEEKPALGQVEQV